MNIHSERFKKVYNSEIAKIEKRLDKLLKGKEPQSLYEPCSYILRGGGKRLRPFLVLISAKIVGGNFKDVYNAALAVELIHNFTLAHDDIMDNSDIRRGRLTLHRKYDINTAILTGDSLIALAYENLLKDCNDNSKKVVAAFTRGIIEVCEGQSLDKDFETRNNISIADYKKMIYKKTAALLKMCCSVGAQLGGASNERLRALSNYGKFLGIAFQIQDDLLDIMAEEREFGKTIGNDLIEGKKTYLFLRALEKAKKEDKVDLLRVIAKKGISRNKIKKYKNLYIKLDVLNDAEREIVKYTKLARKSLSSLPKGEEKKIMYWLANVLITRSK